MLKPGWYRSPIILSLMLFCGAYATREEQLEQLNRELEENGLKLAGGPWYLDDDDNGMLGHKVLWGKYHRDYRSSNWLRLDGYGKDEKWLFMYREDVGKRLYEDVEYKKRLYQFDEERIFTFNTPADIRDLAQKLRNGEALLDAYLIFYKNSRQFWKPGLENPSILLLDPRDFFFSVDQDIDNLPRSFWTLNEAFYKKFDESKQEEARRQQKVTREELELELEKHKAESAEGEAKLEAIIISTRNESAVLKELFSVACKKAEDDKQELHLLLQQTTAVISRQANLLHNTQLILKSLVDRGFGLPPELMYLLEDMDLQNMHSEGAASSGSH